MKKNMMLCVDVITRLQKDAYMKAKKNYRGVVRMVEKNEKLEFIESAHRSCERNPTIWSGEHINVHRNRAGRYTIYLRTTELTSDLDPCTFADELFLDVERAKVELGL